MSRYASEPLKKITININLADYLFVTERYGQGWSEVVRQFIKEKCKEVRDE